MSKIIGHITSKIDTFLRGIKEDKKSLQKGDWLGIIFEADRWLFVTNGLDFGWIPKNEIKYVTTASLRVRHDKGKISYEV